MTAIQFNRFFVFVLLCFIYTSCSPKKEKIPAVFRALSSSTTGLNFTNKLTPLPAFNMFNYMYFYNGAGIGAGDFNNDGLVDLFFASNQEQNKLYINQGQLKFKDVTPESKIPQDGGWSTGVSVVDINNDGLLDIYVCRVGNYEILKSENQLLICKGIDNNGVPFYEDRAKNYGLAFSGFSTQATFLDYDMDGDLDMYLMNHSLRFDGTFNDRPAYAGTYDSLGGDRLYRNDADHFTDVTRQSGINSSIIGYGLGIAVSDINLDGYPDIYIGNDFHENDYLYINQRDGTFHDALTESLMHTSQFSMGVDIADITNDGYPEIISVDMLASDPYILKRSLGGDEYNLFNYKLKAGYFPQYSMNNLQYNRANGLFSEIGRYAGIEATDWSWGPLFMDFDNDGWKDLFISNGIPKRLNDIDYVNFISSGELQNKIRTNTVQEVDMGLIDKFPVIKIPNKFYRNNKNASFTDLAEAVENDQPTFSNGAVYADFDNDGDLDIVVNNIDDPALLYENTSAGTFFLDIKPKGPASNINAVGSKLIAYRGDSIITQEKFASHGFQSAMEIPLHLGLPPGIDSIVFVWPDNTYQRIKIPDSSSRLELNYRDSLPLFNYSSITRRHQNKTSPVVNITNETSLEYLHQENPFVEFDREPLIPHMVSREGPALAVKDINNDGREDIFIGSSKGKKSAIFLQDASGKFVHSEQPSLDDDSVYEDVDACFADLNNDGRTDLVVASGGNEYYGRDKHLSPTVYLNNGKAQFTRYDKAFDSLYLTASCVVPADINDDGYVDLFIGGRAVPWEYGQTPQSYLLQNDGTGRFKNVTSQYNAELATVGFVTQATWFDIDKDEDEDLIVSLEWGGIVAFLNERGKFTKKILTDKSGWWNFALPCDIDNDGDIDFIAGNLGINSRLRASIDRPVRLYYNDFDGNGKKEQVVTYYLENREIPLASKDELQKQIPILKKKYLYSADFAGATLKDIFGKDKFTESQILTANYFSNSILINNGNLSFTTVALPWQAQLAPYRSAAIVDANGDNLPDIFLAGNFYDANIQLGRYDADLGTILVNKGNGNFACESMNGLNIKGEVRHIKPISVNGKNAFVIARNNDSAMVIRFEKKQ